MLFRSGHTHTAVDVALDLRAQHGWSSSDVLGQVTAVDIETYGPGYEIVKEMTPRTPYQAKFSLAYCVAAALLEGRLGLPQFASDRFDVSGVRHHDIADLLTRVRITVAINGQGIATVLRRDVEPDTAELMDDRGEGDLPDALERWWNGDDA